MTEQSKTFKPENHFDIGPRSKVKYKDASKDEASLKRRAALEAYAEQRERLEQEVDPLE